MLNETFKFTVPASLEKAKDGVWKIKGLASTESVDQQGEIIMQKGMDLTPVDQKKGYLNFDHKTGVENLIGTLDGYKKTDKGLYIEGRLFKNHTTAKHVYDIMSSLSEEDRGRAGLSVEGKIIERDPSNPKIIRKCQIKNVAITFNPVNSDTYVDLAKSQKQEAQDLMKSLEAAEVDFDTNKTFTSDEVVELLQKALGIGAGATEAPDLRVGGDALQISNMSDEDKKKRKKEEPKESEQVVVKSLRKLNFDLYKAGMADVLEKLQKLYPGFTRSEIWAAVKDRMGRKFPHINEV